jgi:curved DNA-binding protein CbpA
MAGKLHEHPLTELIREIVAEKLSGSLRLEYERLKTAIYFENGTLVYAISNLRQHRLLECLRRWRVITDEQLGALPQAGKSEYEIGRALIEQGALTEETLVEMRLRQVTDVLRPALLWTTGGIWNFDPRVRLVEDVRVHLELPELLMEAARRLPQAFTAARFPNTNEKVKSLPDAVSNLNILPAEAFILSRLDTTLRLHELLTVSGLPQAETLHACYALALGGFIERESWPRAFTPEEVTRSLAAAQSAAAAQKVAAARQPELTRTETAAKTVEPEMDERLELEELFARMGRATNHYQILGVSRTTDQETLKQTYHRLARRFHPDRFHQDPELRKRVEDLFAKFAQAYETLRDKSARATYDLKLEREKEARPSAPSYTKAPPVQAVRAEPEAPSVSQSPSLTAAERAEDSFQRGLNILKMGNVAKALPSFAEAARLQPRVGRYRAQYGRALAANLQMRHRAETEIQAAIAIEPNNIAYRILLAKLYQNLGFNKRAQGEMERALALDPRNPEAQALLAELQST